MASTYPGSLDSFDTIASDKKTSDSVGGRTHRAMHNDLGDAIEAVQTELGTDPAGASATVKARFEVIEANDWVTSARIAANAVGSSELADDAVDTAAIADSAVTSAKIAAGTIAEGDIADAAVTNVKLGSDVRIGNLLTANQASATDTDAATTGFIAAVGCTFASTTAQAAAGTRSLSFTSSAGGAMSGTVLVNNIEAGYEYTVTAKSRAATTARPVHIYVTWLTEAAGYISAVDATGAITNSASDWTTLRATLVAPATAAKAYFEMYVDASATNEVHYWDCLGMWAGVAGTWRMPGSVVPDAGEVSHIACALANGGSPDYWQPIEDADHAPVGVSHCETAGGKIRLYYAHPTKRVGALVVTGDEVLAGTLNCGASVGLSYADIWLKDLATGGNVDPTTAGLNAGENLWVMGVMR